MPTVILKDLNSYENRPWKGLVHLNNNMINGNSLLNSQMMNFNNMPNMNLPVNMIPYMSGMTNFGNLPYNMSNLSNMNLNNYSIIKTSSTLNNNISNINPTITTYPTTSNNVNLNNNAKNTNNTNNIGNTNTGNLSDYFNYGFSEHTWREYSQYYKSKIAALKESVPLEEFTRDYLKEYTLQNNQNEKSYLWLLPIDLGGLDGYLKNKDNLNYFENRREAHIPQIEYNKINSHFVNLPAQEIRSHIKDNLKHLTAEVNKDVQFSSPYNSERKESSSKEYLNYSSSYLINNSNAFNMNPNTNTNTNINDKVFSGNRDNKNHTVIHENVISIKQKEKGKISDMKKNNNREDNDKSSDTSRSRGSSYHKKSKDIISHTSNRKQNDKNYKNDKREDKVRKVSETNIILYY